MAARSLSLHAVVTDVLTRLSNEEVVQYCRFQGGTRARMVIADLSPVSSDTVWFHREPNRHLLVRGTLAGPRQAGWDVG